MHIAPVASPGTGPVDLAAERALSGSATRRAPTPADAQKAARQFEAIIVRQLLAPSIEPLMNGSSLGGGSAASGGGVYGYLLTDTLAGSVASGGGLGLASVLSRQFNAASAADSLADDPADRP